MTAPHSSRAHALLAPSAAHRWMECPGSVRLSAGIADRPSVYADEGTAAHELAAHCLEKDIDPWTMLGSAIDIRATGPGTRFGNRLADPAAGCFEVDEEMCESVQLYVDSVNSLRGRNRTAEMEVEQRLDMTHLHKEIFGTGDALVYQPTAEWLHVLDFKYGKGVAVDPAENPQLLLYGAGAARRYHNRPLKGLTLHIVQPRAPHVHGPVRQWQTDPFDLMEFEDTLRARAKATEDPDAPLFAGEWCRFCKAAPICPALRDRSKALALAEFADAPVEPSTLSPERLADVLREADMIGNWVKAVQEFAHAEAVAGRPPPGFKLVAKRAVRRWRDEVAARDELLIGYDLSDEEVFTEPKMKSPAQIEKLLGKKVFAAMEGMVVKESSGTNLAPESDPRPAVKADAMAEFADSNVET